MPGEPHRHRSAPAERSRLLEHGQRHLERDRKPGHTGGVVKAVQVLLNQRSAAGLLVDGDFGAVTTQAVRTYQSRQGMVVDGWVGKLTWGRLMPDRSSGGGGGGTGSLVVVNQLNTGHFSAENCGPAANIVALVAVGRTPTHYSSNMNGNRAAVESMRVSCGLSPREGPPSTAGRQRPGLGPGRAVSLGIKGYSRSRLLSAKHKAHDRALIVT